jgi:hypothetical protein
MADGGKVLINITFNATRAQAGLMEDLANRAASAERYLAEAALKLKEIQQLVWIESATYSASEYDEPPILKRINEVLRG